MKEGNLKKIMISILRHESKSAYIVSRNPELVFMGQLLRILPSLAYFILAPS